MLIDPERHLGALGLAKRDGDLRAIKAIEAGTASGVTATDELFKEACARRDDGAASRYLRYNDAAWYVLERERGHAGVRKNGDAYVSYMFGAWKTLEEMPPPIDADGKLTLPKTRRMVLGAAADALGSFKGMSETFSWNAAFWDQHWNNGQPRLLVENYLLGNPELQAIVLAVLAEAAARMPIDVSGMVMRLERLKPEGIETDLLYRLLRTIAMATHARLARHRLSEDVELLEVFRNLSGDGRQSLLGAARETRRIDSMFPALHKQLLVSGAEEARLTKGSVRLNLSISLPVGATENREAFLSRAETLMATIVTWLSGLPGKPRVQATIRQPTARGASKFRIARTFRT